MEVKDQWTILHIRDSRTIANHQPRSYIAFISISDILVIDSASDKTCTLLLINHLITELKVSIWLTSEQYYENKKPLSCSYILLAERSQMLKAKSSEDLVHSREPCCSSSKQEFKDVTTNYSSMDIQHLLINLIYPLLNHLKQQQAN